MSKKIFFVLLFIFFVHLLFRIYTYWDNYTKPYDAGYWNKRYYDSQWVDFRSKTPIGDDGLYAYEGWEYVHGADPTLWNVEVPFLGKYMLGGSIVLFHNQNVFGLLIGLLTLGIFYFFNLHLFKQKLLAFLPVFFFSMEPLFYQQLQAPYFDLLQLCLLFLVFLFAIRRNYIISSLFLGCFAATKFSLQAVLPATAIIIWLYQARKSDIKPYLISLIVSPTIYIVTYVWYFFLGHSVVDFLKVQKYILNFYFIGAKVPIPGTVLSLFLLGVWFTHFKTIQWVPEWHIGWPLLFFMIYYLIWKRLRSLPPSLLLLFIWVIVYGMFMVITPIFPRYLLLLLPFLYNLAIWCFFSKNIFRKFRLL